MSLLILIGLLFVLLVLVVGKALRLRPTVSAAIGAGLCGLALLAGAQSSALPLPIGLAGGSGGLQLDGLSTSFLLLAFLVGALAEADPVCLAATCLTMLAGDLVLLATASALTLLALPRAGIGRGMARTRIVAIGCVVGACALLSGLAAASGTLLPESGFSLIRAGLAGGLGQRDGAVLVPLLVALGVAPLLGLWPFDAWHRRLWMNSPAWSPTLATLTGLFLLLRLLLDLAGAAPAAWYGYGLAALALVSALRAAAAALREPGLRGAVARLLAVQNALAVLGIGLCLLARADDLPVLAATALDAVLLLLPVLVLAGLAVSALAAAMEAEAGASLLVRLGGLIQSMPQATRLAALAVAMLAFLPPIGGYPAIWLLLQAMLAVARPGGIATPAAVVLAIAWIAIVLGLAGLGWLRLAAVAALGRPRTPRGAGAQELELRLGRSVAGMLVLPGLVGLLPGVWLRLLRSVGSGLGVGLDADPPPLLMLAAPGGTAVLSPLALGALLLAAVGGCLLIGRRLSLQPERREPAWEGGIAAAPPWLPFGDPLTQIGSVTPRRLLGQWMERAARPGLQRSLLPRRMLRIALQATLSGSAGLRTLLQRRGGELALLLLAALLGLCCWARSS